MAHRGMFVKSPVAGSRKVAPPNEAPPPYAKKEGPPPGEIYHVPMPNEPMPIHPQINMLAQSVVVTPTSSSFNSTVLSSHGSYSTSMINGSADYNKPNSYLWMSIVVCFCLNIPLGIIAIILSCMSLNAYEDGQMEKSRQFGRASLCISLIGIIMSVVVFTVLIVIYFFTVCDYPKGYYPYCYMAF